MDLGEWQIRRKQRNYLAGAVHPLAGIAWSDGRTVYLTPVQQDSTCQKLAVKVAEFDHVDGVVWSATLQKSLGPVCLLAILHKGAVSVHRAENIDKQLTFRSMELLSTSFVEQGVFWHTTGDVLCVLTGTKIDLYYNHSKTDVKKITLAHVRGTSRMTCGCWSDNGHVLVVCLGAELMIYRWNQFKPPYSNCSAVKWQIPNLDSEVRCAMFWGPDKIVCTTDVTFQQMCKRETDYSYASGDEITKENGVTNHFEKITNLAKYQPKPAEPNNAYLLLCDVSTTAPKCLSQCQLTGLSPTLLLPLEADNCVLVGSYTQRYLQVYQVSSSNHLNRQKDLYLSDNERPWGMAVSPWTLSSQRRGLLLLVGRTAPTNVLFPTLTSQQEVHMHLQLSPLPGYHTTTDQGQSHATSHLSEEMETGNNEAAAKFQKKLAPPNFHQKQTPVNSHQKQAAVNSHQKQAAVNSHQKQATSNSHLKQAASNSHQKQPASNSHQKQAATNSQQNMVQQVSTEKQSQHIMGSLRLPGDDLPKVSISVISELSPSEPSTEEMSCIEPHNDDSNNSGDAASESVELDSQILEILSVLVDKGLLTNQKQLFVSNQKPGVGQEQEVHGNQKQGVKTNDKKIKQETDDTRKRRNSDESNNGSRAPKKGGVLNIKQKAAYSDGCIVGGDRQVQLKADRSAGTCKLEPTPLPKNKINKRPCVSETYKGKQMTTVELCHHDLNAPAHDLTSPEATLPNSYNLNDDILRLFESQCGAWEEDETDCEEYEAHTEDTASDESKLTEVVRREHLPRVQHLPWTRQHSGSLCCAPLSCMAFPMLEHAPTLTIVYKDGHSVNSKLFLLHNGCLRLDTIKQAFHLSLVVLHRGDRHIVLDQTSEGYIPLVFKPSTVLEISGNKLNFHEV